MKYRFEIIYQNLYMKESSNFLRSFDLGDIEFGTKEIMTFSSKKDLKIEDLKKLINEAYESYECTILHIEGGKVE